MSRRHFLQTSAALTLAACRGRSRGRDFDPEEVLSDLRSNGVIGRIRNDRVVLMHKDLEGMTRNGKNALSIIQRGLFALDLVETDPDEFNFGVYGPETTQGVKYLQGWGGVDPARGWSGRRFDKNSLLVLETALEQKIDNCWHPPRDL